MTVNDHRAQIAWLRYYQDVERFNRTLKGQMYDGIWRVAREDMSQSKLHKRWATHHFVWTPLMAVDGPTIIAWRDWAAALEFDGLDAMIEWAGEQLTACAVAQTRQRASSSHP